MKETLYSGRRKSRGALFILSMAVLVVMVGQAYAQTFENIPALNFTMPFGGGNPLPQVVSIASTGANFNFTATASTSQGGNWLSTSPGAGCCSTTPDVTTVIVTAGTLAAGTYNGQVVFKSQDGTKSLTVPVTLTIKSSSSTFFDSIAGGLMFSMKTGGAAPPPQTIPIRNAGSGTLSWTLSTSTADGGNWLTVSASNGTAPSSVTVGILPSKLPNGGTVAGTFDGQLLFHTSGNDVTVPISVKVDPNAFVQLNPINFTMPFGGGNPLPQVVGVASVGTNFNFTATAVTSQGGNWLSTSPGPGCCSVTPDITSIIVNAGTLAAGSYGGMVTFRSQDGTKAAIVPVTLTIEPSNVTFFDSVPGALSFSLKTNGSAPPTQTIPIRNAGSGTLAWTLTASTADGGSWLSASAASGTAPSLVSIGITPSQLPNGGAIAGTFDGQLVFHTSGNDVTVPIYVTVDANAFVQLNPISFTIPFAGGNPLPQVLQVASTGTNFNFTATASTSQGGNWLSTSPGPGCCSVTPDATSVIVANAGTLPAGNYSGQVTFRSQDGTKGVTVPVTLTVEPSSATFFDSTPGELSFSMKTGGKIPPAQTIQIRNAGKGKLKFTLQASTADGGAWLKATPLLGTAPKAILVQIVPLNLPGQALIPGTFNGQLLFESGVDVVTIPVSVTVDANPFEQINPVNFTMPFGGANPLPQVVMVASAGSNFNFTATANTATGGNWLSTSPGPGCCSVTPDATTIIVSNATALAVGTYSGQVAFRSQDGTKAVTVPVTLVVEPSSKAFFDNMPGQSSFSFTPASSGNPPIQVVPIQNGGAGTLNWTSKTSTSDGLKWLKITPIKGAAPAVATVTVLRTKLPNQGKIAGTFSGQQIFQTASGNVTVPVSVTVGDSVFVELPALTFTAKVGTNPLSQTVTVASTGTNFNYTATAVSSKGGAWLTVSPGGGCCSVTPTVETVNVKSSSLGLGSYVGQITFRSQNGAEAMTVPVILTVTANGAEEADTN